MIGLVEGLVHTRSKALFRWPTLSLLSATSPCPPTAPAWSRTPGAALLLRTLRITGLDQALSANLERRRPSRTIHDPAKIITDLAVTLALGGDCLADIAMLRTQPQVFGPVASDPTVSRLIDRLAADVPRALKAIRTARATARCRAWHLAGHHAPGAAGQPLAVDIDATIVIAHSDKQHAAPTWKRPSAITR